MQYWLLKSEPGEWSWDDQQAAGTTPWDGVRNAQAQKNMRSMEKGDRALFYHSGKQRQVVGLVKIARGPYPDPEDESGKRVLVDVATEQSLNEPVTLQAIKAESALADLALVRQPRLSVMPVSAAAWKKILSLAKTNA
jgi:predicted RNA-binding protein with PUA-like domain